MTCPLHEDLTGGSALSTVSLMGAMVVVEVQIAVQSCLHLCGACEEPPAELDTCTALRAAQCRCAPELLQDGAVEPLHEAVRPSMARFGPGMTDPPFGAGLVEPTAEVVALIGQNTLDLPAGLVEDWQDAGGQEASRGGGRELQTDLGNAIRAGRVAGRVLPDSAYPLQLADVERVQTNLLSLPRSLHMLPLASLSGGQLTPGPHGEQAASLSAVGFQHGQSLPTGLQAGSAQQEVDGAGRHLPTAVLGPAQLESQLKGTPGRPGDRQSQDGPLGLHTQRRRPTRSSTQPPRMEPIRTIGQIAFAAALEQAARDPELAARLRDIPGRLRPGHQAQAECVYTVVEGHGRASPPPHKGTRTNGKDMSHDPCSLSTLLRNSTD